MEELLPKWLMRRYLLLSKELKEAKKTEFDFSFAESALKKTGSSTRMVPLFLSQLRKAGWLEVSLDPEDGRRRIYKLKSYEEVFTNYVNDILAHKTSKKR